LAPEGKWILIVPDPQIAYVDILENYFLDREDSFLPSGIHSTAAIDSSANVSPDAKIGAYVVIGANCLVESGVTLHPHVVLYHNVTVKSGAILHAHAVIREHSIIGQSCTIQAGAVIGSDGFGYIQDPKVGIRPVPQVGTVEISDLVDIGSNTCVDRAASGVTRIGKGTKLDNLVQIGHNVEVGNNSIICGQVGIGGSSKIGDGVVLGGQSGIGDHLKITSGVRIGGAGVVISSVEQPGDYMGYPVQSAFKWRRALAAQLALPDFFKNLRKKKI
jgi:UDP-3-O-[3-hydroxymyristoyl] glucosamine N-acyltransferase